MNAPILLAGANSGIGLATARRLNAAGHEILAAGRHHDHLSGLDHVTPVPFDASKEEPAFTPPEALSGLVYFPGSINLKPFQRMSDDDFRADFEINLIGAVRLIRHCLRSLKKADSASIVLFSTVAVQTGLQFHTSIAAAKGAVEGFARSLAADLAPSVRVNCIAPSLTDTPMAASLLNQESKAEAARERHPLKSIGDPDDLAAGVEFLLGPSGKFITGQVLHVDGGLSSLRLL